jgi:ATP-dependent Lhr-like helicase
MLTSNAREMLRGVETVIIDEIHALVPNKRGAHMALSMERLAQICERPPQRIGLSATQHPIQEVARYLGGATISAADKRDPTTDAADAPQELHDEFADTRARPTFRPVTIVDTGEKKKLSIRVEVPVEDMAQIGESTGIASGPAAAGPQRSSIWPAIHPRLLELIRSHQSTLIFVNSRRLAERLAAALNELAGETLVQAHHVGHRRPAVSLHRAVHDGPEQQPPPLARRTRDVAYTEPR